MTKRTFSMFRAIVALLLLVSLWACRKEVRPQYFGTFAVVGGSARELVRERSMPFEGVNESNVVKPDSYFMTWGPYEYPILRKTAERDGKLTIGEEEITLRITPVEGTLQLFKLTPAQPLQSGTYVFTVEGCRDNTANFRCYYPIGVE